MNQRHQAIKNRDTYIHTYTHAHLHAFTEAPLHTCSVLLVWIQSNPNPAPDLSGDHVYRLAQVRRTKRISDAV